MSNLFANDLDCFLHLWYDMICFCMKVAKYLIKHFVHAIYGRPQRFAFDMIGKIDMTAN